MVWTGDMVVGEKTTARDTYVKKSDTEFTHKFELKMKGQWGLIVDETCKKAGRRRSSPASPFFRSELPAQRVAHSPW